MTYVPIAGPPRTLISVEPVERTLAIDWVDAANWWEKTFKPHGFASSIFSREMTSSADLNEHVRQETTADFRPARGGGTEATFSVEYAADAQGLHFLLGTASPCQSDIDAFTVRDRGRMADEVDGVLAGMQAEITAGLPGAQHVVDLAPVETFVPVTYESATGWLRDNLPALSSIHPDSQRGGRGLVIQTEGRDLLASITEVARAGTVVAPDGSTVIGTLLRFTRQVTADLADDGFRDQLSSRHGVERFGETQQQELSQAVEAWTGRMLKALAALPRPAAPSAGLTGW